MRNRTFQGDRSIQSRFGPGVGNPARELRAAERASDLEEETGAALRRAARAAYFAANPRLRGRPIQVHHRVPLEWAYLFPGADPNRLSNLQGLSSSDHLRKATDLWTAFRIAYRRNRKKPTAMDVLRFAALVDRSLNLPYPL